MMDEIRTSAVEDYLKTIFNLREEPYVANALADGGISTQAVAAQLGVAAPSATAMIKRLAGLGLARHTPYRGVELTAEGEKIALEVIRHHRLSETFLAQILGVTWDKAHEEAEKWEHVLSEDVEARMAALLGDPTHDPHGAPIPTIDGHIMRDSGRLLSTVESGTHVIVRRVRDENAELLRHLGSVGLTPGARVEVLRAVPAEGVMTLRVEGKKQIVGLSPAAAVVVEGEEAKRSDVERSNKETNEN
jgi:DtxR family Mn-dependent transcriptional regulator